MSVRSSAGPVSLPCCWKAKAPSRPFLTHDAPMWNAVEPGLRRRVAEAGESRSTRDQVESTLLELLPSGRTEMKDVAKERSDGRVRTASLRLGQGGPRAPRISLLR